MTCSDSNKKRASPVARAALVAGVAGVVSVALAQDSGNRYAQLRAEADIITRANAHAELLLQSQQSEIASLSSRSQRSTPWPWTWLRSAAHVRRAGAVRHVGRSVLPGPSGRSASLACATS